MKQVFDLIETINEKAEEYFKTKERKPATVTVSPRAYRRLLEIRLAELLDTGRDVLLTAMETISTGVGSLRIIIDEMIADTVIEVA